MDLETGVYQNGVKKESWKTVLTLAYQSLGIVYGDLATSPLYVYKSTFAEAITHSETNEEIYGFLSSVFWTLPLVPLINTCLWCQKLMLMVKEGILLCTHCCVDTLESPHCPIARWQVKTIRVQEE